MIVYVLAMIAILAVAAAVVGLVMVGMEGRGQDRVPPWLTAKLNRAAKHLNGEVEPPEAFTRVMERRHHRDRTPAGR
ncbi:hypothetical protein FOE78_10790 [Microlunatus elymi]|uniref:Uncharacterized protein n=1 Tax=Microlunatus elymi TaxID=2596828 RepID=A0A516PYS1_9ACTN|nr:hypothetical protein [Microlunatus elymi]QDP96320.1 hypothetical protein FOE78_10790 [Microlunatus elymi]